MQTRNAEQRLAENVRDCEIDDRAILAQEVVGDVAAHERQQITGGEEIRRDAIGSTVLEFQDLNHVEEQNRPHPVVAASLGELAPEKEPKSCRMRRQCAAARRLRRWSPGGRE